MKKAFRFSTSKLAPSKYQSSGISSLILESRWRNRPRSIHYQRLYAKKTIINTACSIFKRLHVTLYTTRMEKLNTPKAINEVGNTIESRKWSNQARVQPYFPSALMPVLGGRSRSKRHVCNNITVYKSKGLLPWGSFSDKKWYIYMYDTGMFGDYETFREFLPPAVVKCLQQVK